MFLAAPALLSTPQNALSRRAPISTRRPNVRGVACACRRARGGTLRSPAVEGRSRPRKSQRRHTIMGLSTLVTAHAPGLYNHTKTMRGKRASASLCSRRCAVAAALRGGLIGATPASNLRFLASIELLIVDFGLEQNGAACTRLQNPCRRVRVRTSRKLRRRAARICPQERQKPTQNSGGGAAAKRAAVADRQITGRRARTRSATTPAARARSRRRRAPLW